MTQSEVKRIITNMKTKSCELDPIPTHITKQILDTLLPAITKIVNLSLSTGTFSNQWKQAIVRPLLKKKGADLTYKNYRPVSNLQFISKVVERCALLQFSQHCDDHELIPDYQSAYREGYSCETSVIHLLDNILWGMERQEITPCLFLDLSAAFDTVDHDLFLAIMEAWFGMCGLALSWFASYLRPRSFKVSIGESTSQPRNLTFSVPQGSAAGANFFVAYCESLPSVIDPQICLQGFADDHFMHKTCKPNQEDLTSTLLLLSTTFDRVQGWMDGMRLKLNSEKTEFIIIGHPKQLSKLNTKSVNVGSATIEASDCVKCLGTHIDRNLNFRTHTTLKCKTAISNFLRIKSIRKYLTRDACETLCLSSNIDTFKSKLKTHLFNF